MSALKDLYDIIKEVKNLAEQYQNQEIAEKVIQIQEKFFDIREEVEEAKDENRELKETIKQMSSEKEIEKDLELDEQGFFIKKTEKEQGKKVFYCAACWNNYHKLMPLMGTHVTWKPECCNCHTTYKIKDDGDIGRTASSFL